MPNLGTMKSTHDTSPTSGPTLGDALSNPQVVTQIDDAYPVVALSGKPLPTSELESRVTAIDDVDKQGAAFTIKLSNTRYPLRPIEGADGNVDRLIIPVERLSQEDLKVLQRVAETLDWDARMYWTVDRPTVDLAPDTTDLWEDVNRRARALGGSLTLMIIYTLFHLYSAYVVLSRPMPGWFFVGLAILALVFVAVELAARIRSLMHQSSPKWLRRIEDSCGTGHIMLWYSFGGPSSTIGNMMYGGGLITVGSLYFFFLRPQKQQQSSRGLDFPNWMRLELSRSDFAKRMSRLRCVSCDYNIGPSEKCLCPECGLANYYLAERSDARELALKHGAIYSSDESQI